MQEENARRADKELRDHPEMADRLHTNANDLRDSYRAALAANPNLTFGQYVAAQCGKPFTHTLAAFIGRVLVELETHELTTDFPAAAGNAPVGALSWVWWRLRYAPGRMPSSRWNTSPKYL